VLPLKRLMGPGPSVTLRFSNSSRGPDCPLVSHSASKIVSARENPDRQRSEGDSERQVGVHRP